MLTPSQKTIAKDKSRFRVINCGRRFGKTTLAVKEIAGKIAAGKERIAYIAPTYQQARDIAWEMLKKEFQGAEFNESRLDIKVGKQIIQLKGWESIETLRGQKFDFIVIDEIAMVRNFFLHWQEVIRPTLTDTKGSVMFISTPKGFNHFYDLYNTVDEDYKSFHFTSYDNPFLPKEEIDKARKEIPEDRFSQEYMADFRKASGLVYPEFNRELHVTTEQPTKVNDILVGIDWGYKNPASVHRYRKDGDNHYWIDCEFYKTQRSTEQIVDFAKTLKPNSVYPDPAEPDRVEIANQLGLNCMEVSKEIEAGIDSVRALFKQNRIHIHPDCVNLIWELETYHYPDKKPDQNEKELPVKENDHCLVGNTLITMANGRQKKLNNVKTGELVKTQHGFNRVFASGKTRKKEKIFEITLSNGYKLKGTGDHKIFTNRGKIGIDGLRYSDIIEVLTTKKILLWKRQSSSTIKSIIGTVNTIAQSADTKTGEKDYIRQFGKKKTEKYQKDFISTTKITIERTTNSIILSLSRLKNIYLDIIKETGRKKSLEKKLEIIAMLSDRLRRFGIHQQRVLSGTANTVKNRGKLDKSLKKLAKFAERNIKLISPIEADFAIRIVKRKSCGKEDVYNLTIEKEHNYYANGILVKNCMDEMRYVLHNQKPNFNGQFKTHY